MAGKLGGVGTSFDVGIAASALRIAADVSVDGGSATAGAGTASKPALADDRIKRKAPAPNADIINSDASTAFVDIASGGGT